MAETKREEDHNTNERTQGTVWYRVGSRRETEGPMGQVKTLRQNGGHGRVGAVCGHDGHHGEVVQNVSEVSTVIKKQRGIEPRGVATVHVYCDWTRVLNVPKAARWSAHSFPSIATTTVNTTQGKRYPVLGREEETLARASQANVASWLSGPEAHICSVLRIKKHACTGASWNRSLWQKGAEDLPQTQNVLLCCWFGVHQRQPRVFLIQSLDQHSVALISW